MARKEKRIKGRLWPGRNLTLQSGHIQQWQLEQIASVTGRKLSGLKRKNRHHPIPTVLTDTVRYLGRMDFQTEDSYYAFIIKNIRDLFRQMGYVSKSKAHRRGNNKDCNDVSAGVIRNKLESVIAELAGYDYYFIPQFFHELFNKLFAGELTPAEALLKLEWMFDERRSYGGENKENLIDFLCSVSVFSKRRTFSVAEIKQIKSIRDSAGDFQNIRLLPIFSLSLDDIVQALTLYFFHPCWGMEGFRKHFLVLMFLKPPDRLKKTNMSMYLEYYKHNGINSVFKDSDGKEIETLKFFLNRFSQADWGSIKGSHLDQYR